VKDNGGTAAGGVDSTFQDLSITFSDTIIDPSDHHVYHYVVLGNRAWFSENLRRTPKWGTVNSDTNGVLYHWSQAYDRDSTCDTSSDCALNMAYSTQQGLCPADWNIPMDLEWKSLVKWAANGQPDSTGATRLRSRNSWNWTYNSGGAIFNGPGTDNWGFGIKPSYFSISNQGWASGRFWANTSAPDTTNETLGRVFADFGVQAPYSGNDPYVSGFSTGGISAYRYDLWLPIRCVKTLPEGQW
jgi:uncharacterized protein (TIGR02145 family)